ncbi:MAG: MBL fold metallo-hydrolase [Mycobacteriales bacterium]
MRVRIHRGTQEIGGNCVEIAAQDGSRIVLDLGRPLWAEWGQQVELPTVAGFTEADPSLLALIISHPHLDHYGLTAELPVDVPVYVGREAESLLRVAALFSPISAALTAAGHLRHRETFSLGPFAITPFLNDHSAFDAYSLLVEADEQRLFYTGDIRAHGRKKVAHEGPIQLTPEEPHPSELAARVRVPLPVARQGTLRQPVDTSDEARLREAQLLTPFLHRVP